MRQTAETPRGGGTLSGSGSRSDSDSTTAAHRTREPRTLPLNTPNRDPLDSDRPPLSSLSPGEEALRSENGAKI